MSKQKFVDHLFRQESGKMISVLTNHFGIHNLDLVEDAVQEAFIKAFQSWKISGTPNNPIGWLYKTAKNKAIDVLRKEKKLPEVLEKTQFVQDSNATAQEYFSEYEIEDSQLQMMFAICHPTLKKEDQLALMLKIISGFSMKEIANALLIKEDSVKQRISRSKKKIRNKNIKLESPSGSDLSNRLDNVLTALYLVFNEGYYSTNQKEPLRKDLCMEAMRLTKLLTEHKSSSGQGAYSLLALMCYHASRFDSRLNQNNQWISLTNQDRSKWDKELIQVGNYYMKQSSQQNKYHTYQLEAAIAGIHCHAASVKETNWERLLILYQTLHQRKPFPMIALNISILHIQLEQFKEAEKILQELETPLEHHHLYHMVLGELAKQKGNTQKAMDSWLTALNLTNSNHEKSVITKKMQKLPE